ncbi:hypothetical protein [Phytomonospora endophytica]|uniref:Uncharacterized protein n=1 Tax=Phytomonospora endophytica TaxID=714109 RepID=A0A841G178_9ACTN|nr:hypothetical protein [Phytomonospora endophytica]MBB6038429.1 hypothetical protein [Phytomonospora endophytica]GIG64358.1 hypothetical protein Pen01_06530 [Phytomonospora endophytica]
MEFVTPRRVATLPAFTEWAWVATAVDIDGARRLTTQTSTVLAVHDVDALIAGTSEPVRFSVPWRGIAAVSPTLDLAVFPGQHAVRAVDAASRTRWEHRHACWVRGCGKRHLDAAEYEGDRDHGHNGAGSAAFSADGRFVWALALTDVEHEEWLVLDAATGEVSARADTGTRSYGSQQLRHPAPGRMVLSVAERSGPPLLWGAFDGSVLTVEPDYTERLLLDVDEARYLTNTDDRDSLAVHDLADGEVLGTVEPPALRRPSGAGDGPTRWQCHAVFLNADSALAVTDENDELAGRNHHWLVDLPSMHLRTIRYPKPLEGLPLPLGGGRWLTGARGVGWCSEGAKARPPRIWEL